ncbi:MAG: GNAT family N-acetyltransferase [Rhodospirillales bacterium]|nr:GNAT family N-acetyltransferase [Rhodospirillales bacterium]
MEIVDFGGLDPACHADAARILRDALAHLSSAYNAPGEAEAEVALRCADGDWLGFAALEGEQLAGWIGAIRIYSHGWEIHPLVVAPDNQRRGIGSALLAALEARARSEGVLTLFLGSDDDYGGTTLFGRDLWPDAVSHVAATEATAHGHALTFYRRHGYKIVGLLPDVNGAGRPDILLAKRLVEPTTSRSSP